MKQTNSTAIPFRFPKSIILFSVLAIILAVGGGTLAVIRFTHIVENGEFTPYELLKNPLLAVIALFLIVFVVSMLIRSEYVVKDGELLSVFGFVKSKIEIAKINEVTFDLQAEKTIVKYGEEYTVLLIAKKDNEKFIHALLEYKSDLSYDYTMTENKPPKED